MMRDFKFLRRNSGKNLNLEEPENVPVNVNLRESSVARMGTDSHSRPPLNTIQEPLQNPSKPDQESGFKSSKIYRTPTKAKVRYPDSGMPMRTPEKQGVLARNRNGWGQDSRDEGRIGNVNTPRSCRTLGRTSSAFAEPNSTQSTPTKSVGKPPNPGLVYGGNSRPPISGGVRTCNFTALSKGIPVTCNTNTNVNAIEVPHFDLKEDPSFWMDHNVQVLIRIRPLNGMEIGTQGYNRCLKQESAQCLTWVGHPETRFTFDHVACETINQETLFKMVGLPMVENCLSGYNSCMFAYGQTGSGKTHTMLGEINDLEVKPSPYRGMTPRIFEFLFARIIAEEESRRDERLTYCCKCSFLEIYNEQITDLLDPSSTNLQLREDVKKGVYVENLTEFEVNTVGDILKLLSQGSANRRVAATNMNRESSRSHSVFTCVIESRWEKDSTSNLRFARLNLVDLAGSERQKSSGAEGERLKEAASINKSLSTLGHVIMVLVDGANARTRHVPYRDSRLTFLLQDSLGGNSKTMIIANVSPSISSATETLNTLKFAQRAKLIQNNAVINEDASGDVTALQHQIRLLKEELAILKRYNISKSLTFSSKDAEEARQEHENCSNASSLEMNMLKFDNMLGDEGKVLRVSSKQLKSLETSLNGALRREQSTESSIKQLEAEIEQLNCLVRQREEENRCTKMMLKFREDKIQRMESLLAGSIPADSYLLEENNTLSEEIRILRAKVDRNPEVTRFAVENIRLLEQLRRFQDFYEEGEREMLMTEVSELRDQLVLFLDENSKEDNHMNSSMEKEAAEDQKESDSLELELKKSQEELDKCRGNLNSCLEKNSKLCREIVELNALLEMQNSVVHDQDGGIEVIKEPILESSSIGDEASHTVQKMDDSLADTKEVLDLQLELDILKIILKEERLTHGETVEKALSLSRDLKEELQEAKSVIEALEIQQLVSINELEDLKNSNKQYAEILHLPPSSNDLENEDSPLQGKLNKVQASLSKAKRLNMWYQADRACHASNEEEMDEVRRQVESETTEVIVCLQEELVSFQQQMHESSLKERETQRESTLLQEKLGVMTECNKALREKCEEKDRRLNSLSEEIEEVLTAGHKVLDDASNQLGPGKRTWVSDQLQVIARNISEKELRIEELNSYLEDAKSRGNEMECMLRSLRGATLVMSEAHQQDCIKKDQEIHQLLSQLSEKSSIITQLDDTVNQTEEQNRAMSVCATAAFVIVNRFSEIKDGCLEALNQKEAELDKLKGSLTANESLIHSCRTSMGESHSDDVLLKKELESTLESLEGVKTEVADYHSEKEVQFPKKQNPRSIEIILPQVLDLQAVVDNFQEQVGTAMVSLDCRLRTVGELLQQSNKSYFQKRKIYELELIDAKLNAAEKAVESSCYLEKFVEIQHDINEADFMIYELVTANEAMKREVGELRGNHQKQQVINDKDEKLKDNLMMDLGAKEIELFIMSSRLEQMALENNDLEKEKISMSVVLEKFKEDMIISYVDMQLKDWILLEKDAESCLLQKEIKMQEEALKISYNRSSALEQMASEANVLEKEKSSMSMVLEKVKEDMIISYVDLQLKDWILLEKDAEVCLLQKEVRMQEEALKISCNHSSALDKMASENNNLEGKMISMSTVLEKFKEDMIISYVDMHLKDWILLEKDAEIGLMQKEVKMQEEALKISYNHSSALEQMASETIDLKEEKISMSMVFEKLKEDMIILHVDMQLKDWILLEKDAEVGLLQKEVQIQEEEALKIYCDRSSVLDKMASENKDLEKEKISMSVVLEKFKEDIIISYLDMQFKDCILLEKDAEVGLLQKEVEMLEEALKIFCNRSSALEQMASETNDLEKEKIKEDMINLYVDMQLQVKMEEEAHKEENETLVVIINDQKDKIEEFEACIEALEYELCENVVKGQVLEAQLKEKVALISTLEADFSRDRESIKSLSSEIHLLMENVEDALKAKESSKEQLSEMMKAKESMEIEILELETALDKNNTLIESLKGDLKTVTCERSDLHIELLRARKEVEMAQALAEKHEAIAMKAKQTGEISIRYAEEKEEESKLYEKSVEELECTVNVLENQVNMVKGEAERQRLQREELEIELHALKQQIHTVKNSDSDMRRHLDDEKEKNLQDVLQRIKILEKEIASKDAEIIQHKDHITELNLHAEAQAREYKQTFKALEAMADQVKPDGTSRDLSNSPSKRLERNGSRSRGSGSPFKCIGLGLGQQLKSERDEELIAARVRIEELEALAASRQKEIFTINAKLAMSGSMTHDVLRDLLGIKSDMNTYSSIVDDNQIEEVTGKIRIHDADSQVKEQEVIKLKQELNEFVVERQRWREEIERKHVEMEQICLQDQLLATENEKFKKKVIDLEAEIKKLSGLQNIQQRIHHHAKIKEENNSLKAQIDEISHKLRRSEGIVTRVKEELANLRAAANGKHPC
ncbi:kinesin-like protein KIN-12D [Cynara cardunculus var. scolymus]|uniref:kinesin-like protein KIN-12D n=1 Tax=Cynara cardunculus var. scolymus TaxID=59895 RepID=UPI000D630816|nr:kinesin-like protein KIN-12D [Cynara cardunculus var. scolymus]